ncbi:MAG TPA: glycogen/starch synthase [Candidatus Phocaeicola gallinarum]|uniref:Glycogen/starch synthase n=1 Tax=Phocaeicola faecium TaxID=2762213 RepID=A0ABR8V971_9BACT|nr:glycogen/starch synthase [Phocaeicola faecium]MBD8001324.1 glycogen/starch synthase [Phocaeicola faecium]HJC95965.1 glycogen/starch synthase [Candidatus Phocaeicola gallinarum]
MISDKLLTPDYIFESSWEVCNKVGGIYTVLSTRAKTLQEAFPDRLFFIGPDVWSGKENPLFTEDDELLKAWRTEAETKDNLKIRVGRWNIPGNPITILVDFTPFYAVKNDIYTQAWLDFQVDSLHAYGDYDEASMFSYAAGKVVESYYRHNLTVADKVIYHANEWMTGLGALYIQKHVPQIATVFTTHATSIGRSIAGNNKPLYDYLFAYNGDQMARELNMESKHSIEKQTAHHVDCFTTVSDITDNECKELLEKQADVVLVNGFEDDFVPKGRSYSAKRQKARKALLNVANKLLGTRLGDDTMLVGTSGRYEFKNKGINVYLEALNRLTRDKNLKRDVLAFVSVPGWVGEPRKDLAERLKSKEDFDTPLECPFITHWLHNMSHDQVLDMLKYLNMSNAKDMRVKVIFVPCYLDGNDGIVNLAYYDLMPGFDLTVYPSYYEPWGYTPLESMAFKVPTITTDLAGFGLWVNTLKGHYATLQDGVKVIHRTDYNYSEVADAIRDTLTEYSALSPKEIDKVRKNAAAVAEQALWKYFIKNYYVAYDVALRNAAKRLEENKF